MGVAGEQTFLKGDLSPYDGVYDIKIDVSGSRISTMGNAAYGINGHHQGKRDTLSKGNIEITATNTDITTAGQYASGINAFSQLSTGDIIVKMTGGSITASGDSASGIRLRNGGGSSGVSGESGDVIVNVTDATFNMTYDGGGINDNFAIEALNNSTVGKGDVFITLKDTTITAPSIAVSGRRDAGDGDIRIDAQSGSIMTTAGEFAYGLWGSHAGNGDVGIMSHEGHTITTTGPNGDGIVAYHFGTGVTRSMAITVGGSVETTGEGSQGVRVGIVRSTDHDMDPNTPDINVVQRVAAIGDGYRRQIVTVNGSVMGNEAGVYLAGGGRVVIGPRGSIGATSGIAILATGDTPGANPGDPVITPRLRLDLNLGGRRVAQAIGENWIINDGGETTIAVNGVVLHDGEMGVTGHRASNGAWNVRMREEGVKVTDYSASDPANWVVTKPAAGVIADRDFSVGDFNETARPRPPVPPPAPMPRTVRVDEPVFGDANDVAGVHLPVGGRVLIGPAGTVGGESGIAILAEGDAHVDLRLDGRRVAEVIGDDWIINDGGETTIVVNDVTLHDGATGVVEEAVAPNGGNVRVTQRGRRATGVVKDAMAPNGAFNVTMRPEGVTVRDRSDPDPANWVITEPAAGVVADRDFSTEDFIETSTQPMFTEEYAPRAALYELLPDFLLRLMGPGPNRRCGSTPDSTVWTQVAAGQGVYESVHSTTGTTYEFDRFETESGLSASLTKRVKGWASVRHVQGTAGAASPTGGGEIDVRGLGSTVGGSWRGANDAYAVSCFSYMAYTVDFASHQQGLLKAGTNGRTYTLDFEAGQRLAMGETLHLTPRVWVVGSRVSVDQFTDAVDARVSLADTDRVLVGLGVQADTTRPWAGGAFVLRGSVDFEQIISGAKTTTQVSGERLSTEATDNSLLFGLNGVYRHDRVTVGVKLAVRQEVGSTDSEYTSFLNLGMRF